MTDPRVSVVIPCYNRGPVLTQALENLSRQTFSEWEALVIDDCSQDETAYWVKKFSDPRIRLVCHEKYLGRGASRNTGIRESQGDFIAFLDPDDRWDFHKLERQYEALKEAQPPLDLSLTAFTRDVPHKNQAIQSSGSLPLDMRSLLLKYPSFLSLSTFMAPRSLFKKIGLFDESLEELEGLDWFLRYMDQGGQILFVPETLASLSGVSRENPLAVSQAARILLEKHKAFLLNQKQGAWRSLSGAIWFQVARSFLRQGQWGAMIRPLLKAYLYNPTLLWNVYSK